jgi:hypothetical protein
MAGSLRALAPSAFWRREGISLSANTQCPEARAKVIGHGLGPDLTTLGSGDLPGMPLLVHLHFGESEHTLTPRYLDDYLDMGLLAQVNEILAGSPYRLRMHTVFDQTAFVVAVDDAERRALEERGWSFAE